MRLLRFWRRVKFRPFLSFGSVGLHDPADVQRGPADPIGTAPAVDEPEHHETDHRPSSTGDQPLASMTANRIEASFAGSKKAMYFPSGDISGRDP